MATTYLKVSYPSDGQYWQGAGLCTQQETASR